MRSRGVLGATAGTVSHPSISASWLEGQFEFDPGLQTESGSELSERQFTIFFLNFSLICLHTQITRKFL